jgi:Tfp pilus assembly protein PilP
MHGKNYLKFFTLVLAALLLVSCSPARDGDLETIKEEAKTAKEESTTKEADSRETLFVYDQPLASKKEELILSLESAPLLLAPGYVRLVGVVSGGKPLALLEVGGRGLCVEVGKEVGEYKIAKIANQEICLKRKGGK